MGRGWAALGRGRGRSSPGPGVDGAKTLRDRLQTIFPGQTEFIAETLRHLRPTMFRDVMAGRGRRSGGQCRFTTQRPARRRVRAAVGGQQIYDDSETRHAPPSAGSSAISGSPARSPRSPAITPAWPANQGRAGPRGDRDRWGPQVEILAREGMDNHRPVAADPCSTTRGGALEAHAMDVRALALFTIRR